MSAKPGYALYHCPDGDWWAAQQARQNSYPHMCRDEHPQIGHSTDEEMCPVCIEKARADALQEQVREAERQQLNILFAGLFEGQTDEEWLSHAKRYKGGSAESWTIGELIERGIALRRRSRATQEGTG